MRQRRIPSRLQLSSHQSILGVRGFVTALCQPGLITRLFEFERKGLHLRLLLARGTFCCLQRSFDRAAPDGTKYLSGNPLLGQVQEFARREGAPVVAICAALEAQIADMPDEDKRVFLADTGLEEPGLNRVIRAAYELLGLQTYFTAGEKEVRAWTIHRGDTAPKAAAVIHTDFERGFIRAEVISYADYVAHKGEQGAKEAGRMRLEGKEYVVADGDVVHFRFNV